MVSVIIPLYNNEDFILDALESVRLQTAFHYVREIIVINDGSTDSSAAVVRGYVKTHPDMPIALIDKPNGGVASARNAGLRTASGKYIALLDSDDEWLPDKLEWQIPLFEENADIALLGGMSDDSGHIRFLFKKVDSLYRATLKDLCIKQFPATPSIVLRREILSVVGCYNEQYHYAEDGEFSYRVIRNFGYYYHPRQDCVIGHGKPPFGHSGLSANLRGMYDGNVRNIKTLRRERAISLPFFAFLCVFHFAKHLRRLILSRAAKK